MINECGGNSTNVHAYKHTCACTYWYVCILRQRSHCGRNDSNITVTYIWSVTLHFFYRDHHRETVIPSPCCDNGIHGNGDSRN